jgi:hypothetical protein
MFFVQHKRGPKTVAFYKQKQFFSPLQIIGHFRCVSSLETAVVHLQGLIIKGHLGVSLMSCPRIKRVQKLLRLLETVEESKEVALRERERERESERAIERERGRDGKRERERWVAMMNGKREQEATAAAAGSAQTTTCTAKQQLINNR